MSVRLLSVRFANSFGPEDRECVSWQSNWVPQSSSVAALPTHHTACRGVGKTYARMSVRLVGKASMLQHFYKRPSCRLAPEEPRLGSPRQAVDHPCVCFRRGRKQTQGKQNGFPLALPRRDPAGETRANAIEWMFRWIADPGHSAVKPTPQKN
jgi:hypothetical protein